jgi:hypothetical protein
MASVSPRVIAPDSPSVPGKAPRAPDIGFWRRQLLPHGTTAQRWFDFVVGCVLPCVCVALDPIVFRSEMGAAVLGAIRPHAYVAIAIGVAALAVWLVAGTHLGRLAAVVSGVLAAGALAAGLVGVPLLPLSVAGLLLVIGVLGFSPFLVSFVFARNAYRTARAAGAQTPAITAALAVGAALAVAVPWGVGAYVGAAWPRAIEAAAEGAPLGVEARLLAILGDTNEILWAYEKARGADAARAARLAGLYRALTGRDAETALMVLLD